MIPAHLPALQVVVPLLAAPLCLLLPGRRLPWLFATAVSWVALAIAATLLAQVLDTGTISYALGNWAPPWGIEYRIDVVNAFVLLIVSGIGAVVFPYAGESTLHEIPTERMPQFYTLMLLCLTGMLGITITGDAFNLFVFLEVSSLSSYALIAMGSDRRALTAAYQYLIMGSIGATFILIGVGLLYAMTGTLNMQDLAQRVPTVEGTRTIRTAFGFLTVGIGLKLALFPLHLWLPNAYAYAPSAVTAFLAATATKVAVYAMLRFALGVFGGPMVYEDARLDYAFLALALAAIFIPSLTAIFQLNIKRMLAYSSVAQIGYMILGLSLASVTGITATLLHLFNHALMKGALFMALGAVVARVGTVSLGDFRGLGRRMPFTMAAFVIGGLSLIGVPLTVGFISKWYLVVGAIERGWWPAAVLVVGGSLLAVIYIWRVVEVAYFHAPGEPKDDVREAPLSLLISTWTLILATIYFGVDTDLTVGVAHRAAELLMGVAP